MTDTEALLSQLGAVSHANILLLGGVLIIALGLVRSLNQWRYERMLYGLGCLSVLAVAAGAAFMSAPTGTNFLGALFVHDAVTHSGAELAILAGILLTLLGWEQLKPGRAADHYGGFLLMLSGLAYAAAANDLISLFLALELVSISTTVLLGISRRDDLGREATLKYFALAAFTSAIMLLGASYLYGLAGSTALPAIHDALAGDHSTFARIALGLTLCGLCFRVTAVPFHFYAPDVFAGSAPHMAASMALVPKAAGFVAMVRLLGGARLDAQLADIAVPLLLVIAVATMVVGNCAALIQTRLRRLLAYSSIAHSGYLLLAVAALLSTGGSAAVVFDYLMVYAAMTLGLFAMLMVIERTTGGSDDLADAEGLFFRHPWLACGGVICLLSLTGLPLSGGFWAKLQVFVASLTADRIDLRIVAVVMAINAAIAAVYYLSLVCRLFQPNRSIHTPSNGSLATGIACGISSVLTVLWFFFP